MMTSKGEAWISNKMFTLSPRLNKKIMSMKTFYNLSSLFKTFKALCVCVGVGVCVCVGVWVGGWVFVCGCDHDPQRS